MHNLFNIVYLYLYFYIKPIRKYVMIFGDVDSFIAVTMSSVHVILCPFVVQYVSTALLTKLNWPNVTYTQTAQIWCPSNLNHHMWQWQWNLIVKYVSDERIVDM